MVLAKTWCKCKQVQVDFVLSVPFSVGVFLSYKMGRQQQMLEKFRKIKFKNKMMVMFLFMPGLKVIISLSAQTLIRPWSGA